MCLSLQFPVPSVLCTYLETGVAGQCCAKEVKVNNAEHVERKEENS